jgi:hypothetical protein
VLPRRDCAIRAAIDLTEMIEVHNLLAADDKRAFRQARILQHLAR